MMTERKLEQILARYQNSFTEKVYAEENEEHDILMDVFGISPIIKKENRQYWGRELAMCWQLLVTETAVVFSQHLKWEAMSRAI